jgi:hypothetical protein
VKIRISKSEVLKAIAEEPMLFPGFWLGDATLDGQGVVYAEITPLGLKAGDTAACRVCAVGAVFRRLLPADLEASEAVKCVESNISGRYQCVPDIEEREYPDDSDDDEEEPPLSYLDQVQQGALDMLRADEPWNALSYLFEGLCQAYELRALYSTKAARTRAQAPVRRDLAAFVTNAFPEDLTLEVAEYRPRIPYKEVP